MVCSDYDTCGSSYTPHPLIIVFITIILPLTVIVEKKLGRERERGREREIGNFKTEIGKEIGNFKIGKLQLCLPKI